MGGSVNSDPSAARIPRGRGNPHLGAKVGAGRDGAGEHGAG